MEEDEQERKGEREGRRAERRGERKLRREKDVISVYYHWTASTLA